MGDACFCLFCHKVEDGSAGSFGAGAGGGGDGDEREEGFGDGETAAQGRVHKVKEVVLGEAGIEIHEFGRINYTAPSNG